MTPAQQILKLESQFKGALLRLPLIIGNEAVNFTLDNFRMQGFLGYTFQPWPARKQGWKKKARNGSLLVFSGALRRSIRITRLSTDSVAML